MLVLPLPVMPRSRRVGLVEFLRAVRACFCGSLSGIRGSLRELVGAPEFNDVLLRGLEVNPAGTNKFAVAGQGDR